MYAFLIQEHPQEGGKDQISRDAIHGTWTWNSLRAQ